MPRFASSSLPVTLRQMVRTRRIGRVALACSALALLSACGGGDRAEEYKPDRVVALGDENSAFTSASVPGGQVRGLVYSVNDVVAVPVYCAAGTATQRCDHDGTPSTADDVYSGSEFDFTPNTGALPWGDGTYITPATSADLDNTVRLLTIGGVTYKDDATPPVSQSVPSPGAKRDIFMHYDCAARITAVQYIAAAFGKGFSNDCPTDIGGAMSYAQAGARIADFQVQLNQAKGAGQIAKGSLVVVWVGQNDIIDIANSSQYGTLEAKRLEAKIRADRLAQMLKPVLSSGAKLVLIGVPDLSYSPWGAANASTVQELVTAFNGTLELGDKETGLNGLQSYTYNGRDYTFIRAGLITKDYATSTSYVNNRVCPTPADVAATPAKAVRPSVAPSGAVANVGDVQFCTNFTRVNDGNTSTYIWADDSRLGKPVHAAIGNAAVVRAVDQF